MQESTRWLPKMTRASVVQPSASTSTVSATFTLTSCILFLPICPLSSPPRSLFSWQLTFTFFCHQNLCFLCSFLLLFLLCLSLSWFFTLTESLSFFFPLFLLSSSSLCHRISCHIFFTFFLLHHTHWLTSFLFDRRRGNFWIERNEANFHWKTCDKASRGRIKNYIWM